VRGKVIDATASRAPVGFDPCLAPFLFEEGGPQRVAFMAAGVRICSGALYRLKINPKFKGDDFANRVKVIGDQPFAVLDPALLSMDCFLPYKRISDLLGRGRMLNRRARLRPAIFRLREQISHFEA
jgi:hypothetical protein